MNLPVPQTQKPPECQFLKDTLPCCSVARTSTVSVVKPAKHHLVNMNWEGLGSNRSHPSSRYSTLMFGGTGEEHENFQDVRFGCGIRTGDFGVQVGGVSACAKLLREIRNSFLPVTERSLTSSFTNIETLTYPSTELQGAVSQQAAILHLLQVYQNNYMEQIPV